MPRLRPLPQVPAAFIGSFPQRNPVNRELLLAARSAANATPQFDGRQGRQT